MFWGCKIGFFRHSECQCSKYPHLPIKHLGFFLVGHWWWLAQHARSGAIIPIVLCYIWHYVHHHVLK